MAHSAQRRYTTAHDRAALRLHPDGTRAASTSKRQNLITHDIRGNVFATDASGPFKAKQRRKYAGPPTGDDDLEEAETFDLDAVNSASDNDEQGESSKAAGKRNAATENGEDSEDLDPPLPKKKRKTSKAAKRRQHENDYSFLNPPLSSADIGSSTGGSQPANPSPDLLKAIHHFASRYYDETGQLYDATRAVRREKRRRKQLRESMDTTSKQTSPIEDDDDAMHDDADEVMHEEEARHDPRAGRRKLQTRRTKKGATEFRPTDMYKAFDGTALVAVGMLVQQFVEDAVKSSIPEEWESEMLAWDKKHKKPPRGHAGNSKRASVNGEVSKKQGLRGHDPIVTEDARREEAVIESKQATDESDELSSDEEETEEDVSSSDIE